MMTMLTIYFVAFSPGLLFFGSSGIFQAASGDDNVDNVVFCIGHLHLDSIDPWLVPAFNMLCYLRSLIHHEVTE